jgi:hypothetical protein
MMLYLDKMEIKPIIKVNKIRFKIMIKEKKSQLQKINWIPK